AFVRSGTNWTEQAKLTAPDPGSFDGFGLSVALDGDTAMIGAPAVDTPAGADAGSAYAFVRSGTTWTVQAHLVVSGGAAGDGSGTSVAVRGNTAMIGAPAVDIPAGADAGSAYVFIRSGTLWTQQAELIAPDGAAGDAFGTSVALAEGTAVAGGPGDDILAKEDVGSAYVLWR
ncbi:MAG: hypothetical protein ABR518_10025, partial [Actinomycetota bacterium]